MYYHFIEGYLNGVRYPWGLLPAEYLFFRKLGRLSAWFPFGCLAALVWSFIRPAASVILFRACIGILLAHRNV